MRELLRVENLSTPAVGVAPLKNLSFHVLEGETVSIVGGSGAGEENLCMALSGNQIPSSGDMFIMNTLVKPTSALQMQEHGVYYVSRESLLVERLTIAENLFALLPRTNGLFYNTRRAKFQTSVLLEHLGLSFKPDMKVEDLSRYDRFLMEIVKCYNSGARLIILNNTMRPVNGTQAEQLSELMKKMINVSFIYVTNELDEMLNNSNRVLVLRDGSIIGYLYKDNFSSEKIVSIVGKAAPMGSGMARGNVDRDKECFRIERLSLDGEKEFSLEVFKGERVGVLHKNAEQRLTVIERLMSPEKSGVSICGKPAKSYENAVKLGMTVLAQNSQDVMWVRTFDFEENIMLKSLKRVCKLGTIRPRLYRHICTAEMKKFENDDLKIATPWLRLKTAFCGCMAANPKITLLDNVTLAAGLPTRKRIHDMINMPEYKDVSFLVVSESIYECYHLCHRFFFVDGKGDVKCIIPSQIGYEECVKTVNFQ